MITLAPMTAEVIPFNPPKAAPHAAQKSCSFCNAALEKGTKHVAAGNAAICFTCGPKLLALVRAEPPAVA